MRNQNAFFVFAMGGTCFFFGQFSIITWGGFHQTRSWSVPEGLSPRSVKQWPSALWLLFWVLWTFTGRPKNSIGGDPTLFRIESPLPIFQKMASKEKHTQRFQIFSHPRLVQRFFRECQPRVLNVSEWWLTSITWAVFSNFGWQLVRGLHHYIPTLGQETLQ